MFAFIVIFALLVTCGVLGVLAIRENRTRHAYVEEHQAHVARTESERDKALEEAEILRGGLLEVVAIGTEGAMGQPSDLTMSAMIDQAHISLGKATPQIALDKDA